MSAPASTGPRTGSPERRRSRTRWSSSRSSDVSTPSPTTGQAELMTELMTERTIVRSSRLSGHGVDEHRSTLSSSSGRRPGRRATSPRAEVVERDPNAALVETAEDRSGPSRIGEDRRLGDLDLEPFGRSRRAGRTSADLVGQRLVPQAAGRDVDGNRQGQAVIGPLADLEQRPIDDPCRQGPDQAGRLDHRDGSSGDSKPRVDAASERAPRRSGPRR